MQRTFLLRGWLLTFALWTLAGCRPATDASPALPSRPNVLLLIVDDLRPALGAYGNEQMHTPHVDRLAAQGLLFERAYVQEAICAPSRASLLTGLRPDSLGFYGLNTPVREALPEAVTLPEHFQQHGYTTVAIGGKVFHHDSDGRAAFGEMIEVEGGGKGRGYLTEAAIASIVEPAPGLPSWRIGKGPAYESAAVPDTAYVDGKIARRAAEALGRLANQGQPFFLAVGFQRPHLPFNCPQRYWDRYPPEEAELPANYFPPENAPPYALGRFGELRAYTNIPEEGPVPKETALTLNRGYRACVSYVDAQIGRVLGELERQGLAENTIVVLWSDHGFKLGEHRSWLKHTNFEIDTRIPLIVRVPGYEGGRRTDALVETVDIYPTLAELAGLPAPEQHQGLSFAPLLANPEQPWKEAAFSQYPRGKVMGRAIRTARYRYVEWRDRKTKAVLARALYDHRTDPNENVNVAGRPAYAEEVERLSQMLEAGWRGALPEGAPLASGGRQR